VRSLILSTVVALSTFGLLWTGPSAARAAEAPAKIHVLLPASATLTIDGAATNSTSDVRDFVTPPLEAGKDFHYGLRARLIRNGNDVTIERRVTVRAGSEAVVDMTLPGAPAFGNEANQAFYYSPSPDPAAPAAGLRSFILTPPAPSRLPADVGGARNNWKPDLSDPSWHG